MILIFDTCAKKSPIEKLLNNQLASNLTAARIMPEDMESAFNHFINITLSDTAIYESAVCDDAVLLTEVGLNYNLCKPSQICDQIAIDSTTFSVTAVAGSDGQYIVSSDNMQNLYDGMKHYYNNMMTTRFPSDASGDKKLVLIDLEPKG